MIMITKNMTCSYCYCYTINNDNIFLFHVFINFKWPWNHPLHPSRGPGNAGDTRSVPQALRSASLFHISWRIELVALFPNGIKVIFKNKVGERTHKQDGTQHTFFKKSGGVGSCALHETDARSLLRHRAHWWHQGPQFTTACCVSYVYILLVAISAHVTLSHLSSRYLCLGSRLVWFAAGGARTKRGRTEHGATWKLNDNAARKKSRRELTKRALTRRCEDDRSWIIMKNETW